MRLVKESTPFTHHLRHGFPRVTTSLMRRRLRNGRADRLATHAQVLDRTRPTTTTAVWHHACSTDSRDRDPNQGAGFDGGWTHMRMHRLGSLALLAAVLACEPGLRPHDPA